MAELWKGVSAYGAPAYNKATKQQLWRCYPPEIKRPAIALLHGSFGPAIPIAKQFCKRFADRPHLVYYILSNECARRTGRKGRQICDWLTVEQYDKALREKDVGVLAHVYARTFDTLTRLAKVTNAKTHLWFSVGLEDNLSQAAALVLCRQVAKAVREFCNANHGAFPAAIRVVRNPMVQQSRVGKFLVERHGRNVGQSEVHSFDGIHVGSIASNDIQDIGYANAAAAVRAGAAAGQVQVVFAWSAIAQGWKNQAAQQYLGRTHEISDTEVEGFQLFLRTCQP